MRERITFQAPSVLAQLMLNGLITIKGGLSHCTLCGTSEPEEIAHHKFGCSVRERLEKAGKQS